jgi:parvulin-like peptidyl-prolyl isomerase
MPRSLVALAPHGLLALCGALALCGCQSKDPVVLELETETVRRSDFARHLAEVESRGLGPLSQEARRGLLEAFLEQRALAIEARRRGLLEKGASGEREVEAVLQLLRSAIPEQQITEQEIAAFGAAHAAQLVVPESVTLRQILVASLNEARDVKRRLGRDPREFDTLARGLSKGPEAAMGGYMGSFERGQLPAELEAAAFALAEGATSDPIETPLGYHVLRVESRRAARDIPAEEARERIRGQLAREKRTQAERAFVAQVMARAKVNHEAALRPARRS